MNPNTPSQISLGSSPSQLQTQATQPANLADILPTALGIGGGIVGSELGPVGSIGLSAAGSGFGEFLRQMFEGQKPDIGSIGKEALLGGAGQGIGEGIGGLTSLVSKGIPSALDKAGTSLLSSQYAGVPTKTAIAYDLPGTINALNKYGINNINDVASAADTVTGQNGIVNAIKQRAIANAAPIDTTGVLDLANNLIATTPTTGDGKIISFVDKTLTGLNNGADSSTGLANPTDVFDAIKQLETQANSIKNINQVARTSQDINTANIYNQIANELKTRLYTGTDGAGNVIGPGADSVVTQGLMTPEEQSALSAIHPTLASDVASAQTVGDLRGIESPFVRGSILSNIAQNQSTAPINTAAGVLQGVGRLIQNPMNLVAMPLSTDTVNSGLGSFLKGSGKMLGSIPLPTAAIGAIAPPISQMAAQSMGNPQPAQGMSLADVLNSINPGNRPNPGNIISGNSQIQGQAPMMPMGQSATGLAGQSGALAPGGGLAGGGSTDSNLRQALAGLMFGRARTPQDVVTAFQMMYPTALRGPLSPEQQKLQINGQQGLQAINTMQQVLAQNPNAPLEANIPIISGRSPYSAARNAVLNIYTNLMSGAQGFGTDRKIDESVMPQPFDSPAVINYKLGNMQQLFNKYANGQIGGNSTMSSSSQM